MPNKTIYVSDADLPLYERAQELVGGNLSQAIVKALRRYVDVEEGKDEGFEEITVRVGPGKGRRQRFLGVLLVKWHQSTKDRVDKYKVYRSRTGKYVVHAERSPEQIWAAGADGQAKGWRKHVSSDQTWGTTAAVATLEIFDDLDALREKVPASLYDLVAASADVPEVEDLDI